MPARHAVLLTPVESAHPRSLLPCKQNAPASHSFSTPCSLSQVIENTATLSPAESALARLLRSEYSKALIAAKILPQLLHLPHFQGPLESAHSKELTFLLESALTENLPATPLESALKKMAGGGGPVFKELTSAVARSLRESFAPLRLRVGFLFFFSSNLQHSTFDFQPLSPRLFLQGFFAFLHPCFFAGLHYNRCASIGGEK